MLSGCANLASLGDIEGLGKTGEALRAIETIRTGFGGKPRNKDVTAVVNRTMGEYKALEENIGDTDLNNLPQRIQRFGYILENVK